MYMLVLVFVLACVLGVWKWFSWRKYPLPPSLPGGLPIIGHSLLFIADSKGLFEVVRSIAMSAVKHGGILHLTVGPRTLYVITDPDDCQTVANSCLQKDFLYDFAKPWLGDGLVTAAVPIWKRHRKLLNPGFSQHVLDGFLGVFNSQAARLVRDLSVETHGQEFNISRYLVLNGLQTVGLTAMGVEFDDDDDIKFNSEEYLEAIEKFLKIAVKRFLNVSMHSDYIYNFSALKKKQDDAIKVLHYMSDTVMNKRKSMTKESRENGPFGPNFKPFMDMLLELASQDAGITDAEIREEVDTMIVAGHDTSATVLTFIVLMLGSYPDVQEKAYREVQDVMENSNRDVEKKDLSKLVYLDAIIKETIRLYPIGAVIARHAEKDIHLKKYTVPAGISCFMFIYGLHRNPALWGKDAERFNPERWLNPATLPSNPNAFAGFSIGRRMCIGKTYAMMSMKTTLVHFLRSYRVTADERKLKLRLDVMLKPAAGHEVILERRATH